MVEPNTQNCSKPHAIEIGKYISFTYLGSLVTSNNNVIAEITSHLIPTSRSYCGLKSQLKSQSISRKTKILIYKTLVRP
jgi:hypothetical protein